MVKNRQKRWIGKLGDGWNIELLDGRELDDRTCDVFSTSVSLLNSNTYVRSFPSSGNSSSSTELEQSWFVLSRVLFFANKDYCAFFVVGRRLDQEVLTDL
ncbi:unnamed protein product [Brugia timori]|uniref:DUF295 domain-containing protein n=1 Tax=Brugia timori TaxID=42155 RepID=A0A0R3Q425_9BILA|nr:unnamed protein product [Brugia timori]